MKNFAHICIDASITEEGVLGVGIFDITNNQRIALTYTTKPCRDAYVGESMALICAMEYAHKNGFKKVHFFTDNKRLGDEEINPKFLEKFPFESIQITWIPRDLNKEADKMSKAGRNPASGHWAEAANEPSYNNKNKNIKSLFSKYNYTQKVKFLSKMAKTNQEKEFIRMLKEGVKGDYGFLYSPETSRLIRMAKTIFMSEEAPLYVRKRMNKFTKSKLQKLTFDLFEKEFKKRKTQEAA